MLPTLYHFTCDHGRAAIGDTGQLVPALRLVAYPQETVPTMRYVWLTDLHVPIPAALGLTRDWIVCDRSAYRYRVTDDTTVVPWVSVSRDMERPWRAALEFSPGAKPRHWFVSSEPVPVAYDPVMT